MRVQLPSDWKAVLADEVKKSYFQQLKQFVDEERAKHKVFPPERRCFQCLQTDAL